MWRSSMRARAAEAKVSAGMVSGEGFMMSAAVSEREVAPTRSSMRRRSPSEMMPWSLLPMVMVVRPSFLRDIS